MSYLGNSPGVASQRVETALTATSSQTVFTPSSGYTLGYCDVYQNGVKLVNGDDYTAADGATVTLTTGAATGDSIVIVASFPRGLSDGYLKSEADAKYVALTGDQTVAGVKTLSSNPILSGGTVNGVPYLNGSKVLTSGSALVFDGTNLGLGLTPSAWNSAWKGIQLSPTAALTNRTNQNLYLSNNWYIDSGSTDRYIQNGYATFYSQNSGGQHAWYISATGTAGNAISFTQAMTLDASGTFMLGTTTGYSSRANIYGTTTALDSGGQLYVGVTDAIAADKGGQIMMGAYYSGTTITSMGGIAGKRETATSGNYDGYLQFLTSTQSLGNTEKARITSGGVLLVNATARANASEHTSIRLAVAGEAHLQSQGCHLWFGDSVNSSPLGIGEGLVNTVGTDSDFLSVYYRGSCRFFTGTTETARFDNSGNLLVGATSSTRKFVVEGSNSVTSYIHNTNNSNGVYAMIMALGGANTNNTTSHYLLCDTDNVGVKAVIFGNGNMVNVNNSYGAYSDVKLKENIVDASPKLADLLQVRVVNYNLKSDPEHKQLGVVAQELEQIFPGMVEETPDTEKVTTTDEDGNEREEHVPTGTTTKGVKYSVFVPMLIKAIQEQQAIIEQLQADVATLKGTP